MTELHDRDDTTIEEEPPELTDAQRRQLKRARRAIWVIAIISIGSILFMCATVALLVSI